MSSNATIALNRQASHEYFIEEEFVAGVALEGWEVKALRAGRANIKESYVMIKNGEIFLYGCQITPLTQASTHMFHDPTRTRKLLLLKREIIKLRAQVDQDGMALIPLKLFWSKHLVKLSFALAKGKKLYDKRATIKERDWKRDKERLLKVNLR